jgi:hypothetical protein
LEAVVAKVWLRGDAPAECGVTVALEGDGFAVPAFVAGDTSEAVADGVSVEVRQREFAGYDADGNPVFEWDAVVAGEAVVWEVSDEVDQFSSVVTGRCVVLYAGQTVVTEGATVVHGGRHWDVTQVKRPEGRLEMKIRRVEAS